MKHIKNLASSILIASMIALAPFTVFAQTSTCQSGKQIINTGVISQVIMQDDQGAYQIGVWTKDNVFFLMEDANATVARVAGSMIGKQISFGGKVLGSNKDCSYILLATWHFGN